MVGLDAAHGRLCRDFADIRDDHGGSILSHMAIAIRKLDLAAVSWIAATLLMNVERDLQRRLVTHRKCGMGDLSIYTPTGLAALENAMSVDMSLPVAVWRARLTKRRSGNCRTRHLCCHCGMWRICCMNEAWISGANRAVLVESGWDDVCL